MLKKSLLPALLVATALLPLSVAAAEKEQNYMGFIVGDGDWEDDDGNQLFGMRTLGLKLGRQVTDHFGYEGRYLTSTGEDGMEPEMDYASINATLKTNLNDNLAVYAQGGFAIARFTAEDPATGTKEDEDESSPTVGVGANIGKLNGIYINIEYSRLYQDSDVSFDSFGFGLTGTF
ncbi:MAG: outer membrane beta-barrel protein [Pseudomonadota bacterium]